MLTGYIHYLSRGSYDSNTWSWGPLREESFENRESRNEKENVVLSSEKRILHSLFPGSELFIALHTFWT
jgi:hypothetical protein